MQFLRFGAIIQVQLSANPLFHARTKHVGLDLHFVREKVLNKELQVNYVPVLSSADALTKPLAAAYFHEFRQRLCVHSFAGTQVRLSMKSTARWSFPTNS